MVVRVHFREERRQQSLIPRSVRPVVVGLALLVLHDLALVVEVLLRQGVEERAHPVGLEPQRQLDLVGGHRLVVVGPVEPGAAVRHSARGLDGRDVLGLLDVGRTLEHHVLEEVGEAGPARLLVLGADAVPEVDRGDGDEMVLGDDQAQAVGQALIAELDSGNGHAGMLAQRRGQAGKWTPGGTHRLTREPRPVLDIDLMVVRSR